MQCDVFCVQTAMQYKGCDVMLHADVWRYQCAAMRIGDAMLVLILRVPWHGINPSHLVPQEQSA